VSAPEPEIRLLRADRAEARQVSTARVARYRSRAYREPWALLAWHERRVGVDIEQVTSAEESFVRSICTREELRIFAPMLGDVTFVAALWSGKEALAKALGNAIDYDPQWLPSPLGWPRTPDAHAPGGRSEVRHAGNWCARRLARPEVPAGHVGWVVWERPGADQPDGFAGGEDGV
jgi:hypothetical protein